MEYRTNLNLTPFQAEIIIGLLLGDLYISKQLNVKGWPRSTVRHSMSQFDYLQHIQDLFEPFIVQPVFLGSTLDPRTKQTYSWCHLHTLYLKCFLYYRTLFYDEVGVKHVPTNIDKLLTHIGLAYWLSDDRHFHKAGKGVCFCTVSFSLVEVELLVSSLKKTLNLVGNIHFVSNRKYNRIY